MMDDQQPPATKPRSRTRLIVQAVFSLALVVVLFYYLLKDVDLAQVWANIRAMTWREDAILVVLAAWNLASYAFVWMSVTRAWHPLGGVAAPGSGPRRRSPRPPWVVYGVHLARWRPRVHRLLPWSCA